MSEKKKMRYNPDEIGFKSKRFEIRIDEKTFKKLENLSKRKKISKSEVIRELIEKSK